MKNKLVFTTLFYILGIIISYNELLTLGKIVLIFPIIFLMVIFFSKNIQRNLYYFVVILLSIIIGFFISKNNSNKILDDYYGNLGIIEGKIIEKDLEGKSFTVKTYKLTTEENTIEEIGEKIIINLDEEFNVDVGTRIIAEGRILEPLGSKNRFVFNYKSYLSRNNITANMFLDKEEIEIISSGNIIDKSRISILERIEEFIDENLNYENSRILKSVIFGDTEYLDDKFLQGVRNTGIAHVFAVSGLHIGIFIAVFTFIFKILGLNIRKCQIMTLLFLWYYGFIIGFPISILRALILFSVITLGNILLRKNSPFNALSFTALILLIYNPHWLFDAGFQLSFITTINIYIYIYYISPQIKSKNINKLLFIPFVQMGIIPILAFNFNYISIFSFIGNLILVPIFSLLLSVSIVGIVLSFLIMPLAEIVFLFIDKGFWVFKLILDKLFIFPYLGIDTASPNLNFLFIYYALLLYTIGYNNFKIDKHIHKFITYSIVLFVFFNLFITNYNEVLEVSFLDVGQGNASYIKYKDKNILIDVGGDVYSSYNKGETELPEYIKKRGIFNINLLFISHFHEDHYCSLDEIKKVSNIENIFINGMNESLLRNFNSNIEILSKGDKIVIDDNLSIDILWPDKNFYSNDENENSLVLLIKYKDKNILYTGDINKNIEEKISKNVSKTNILLVPHHGSDTSSSEDFLAKLSPEVAIFSYGHNFYGIPSLNVVDRYKKYGIESYSTFKDGEIWSIMNKDGYKVYTNKNSVNNELNLFELLFALVVIYLTLMYLEEREIYYEEI